MYNHAPKDYQCPICLAINGIENYKTMIKQDDIIYRDDLVTAIINSKFVGKNHGHVIIVPNQHFENLYDLPENVASHIIKISKKIALAMKVIRKYDGIMILQNNEPASDQHAFHYHMHIFPRFNNDNIHQNMGKTRVSTPEERKEYSKAFKKYFAKLKST